MLLGIRGRCAWHLGVYLFANSANGDSLPFQDGGASLDSSFVDEYPPGYDVSPYMGRMLNPVDEGTEYEDFNYEDEVFYFEDETIEEEEMQDADAGDPEGVNADEDEDILDEDALLDYEEKNPLPEIEAANDEDKIMQEAEAEEDFVASNFDVDTNYTNEELVELVNNYSLSEIGLDYDSRRLMSHHSGNHMPLECNANLAQEPCQKVTSLNANEDGTFVVPCGNCVELDIQDGSTLDLLPDGLRIEGKLYIPGSSSFTLKTKFIFVLGLLKIDPLSNGNKVKFLLEGEDEVTYYGESGMKCGGGCNMGSKAIAVLGGQLDIQGYDPNCPTWEKLEALGPSTPRPFVMPEDGTGKELEYEITGDCAESPGHTRALKKRTVYCPIAPTATIKYGEWKNGIKFTTMPPLPPPEFSPPALNWELQSKGGCRKAGHTKHFGKCVVWCPVSNTAEVRGGDKSLMTFTSTAPKEPEPFVAPRKDGIDMKLVRSGRVGNSAGHTYHMKKCVLWARVKNIWHIPYGYKGLMKFKRGEIDPPPAFKAPAENWNLRLAGNCKYAGHTKHFNKCTIWCPLMNTPTVRHGDRGLMTFTSTAPVQEPFAPPRDGATGKAMQLVRAGRVGHSAGHTRHVKKCVLWVQVTNSDINFHIGHGTNMPKRFTNLATGQYFDVSGVHHWAWRGKTSFIYADGYSYIKNADGTEDHSECMQAAVDFQSVFNVGDEIAISNRYADVPVSQTFNTNGVHHWSWAGKYLFFFPQQSDPDYQSCQAVAEEFNEKFPPGYGIDISYRDDDTIVTGPDHFNVTGIHHYAWGGRTMFFYPSGYNYDPQNPWAQEECNRAARDFANVFKIGHKIELEHRSELSVPVGQTMDVNAVHHWSWNGNSMFFFPEQSDPATCDDVAAEFNQKFPTGYGIDIKYRRDISIPTGQEIIASKGVHHFAWSGKWLFFFPDEDETSINAKIQKGYRLQVSYTDAVDHHQIRVSQNASNCWKEGTELLLTSHTKDDNDRSVVTVTSVDPATRLITFDKPLDKVITKEDHESFAIEVASLNRPVIFEAKSDFDDSNIGGHLWIHHTTSKQHIEGVEIKNFGQQGRLGRYPIHFHASGNHPESIVKRNVVRDSNQRCYVIHNTNQVTIEDNVAHNTIGHCYFLEAGTETGNTFRRNLAAGVNPMSSSSVAKLSAQSKREETDFRAAVFWISHAENAFYDNVVGGSNARGYWFETHRMRDQTGHHDHSRVISNLIAFENNEAHSCRDFAFRTYRPGWRPSQINTLKNLKVYRNRIHGAFLHASRNLVFEGGVWADNGLTDILVNRADSLTFDGTIFIGQTPFTKKSCISSKVAISLNPTRLQEFDMRGQVFGTSLVNTEFYNFTDAATGCSSTRPLAFNWAQVFREQFAAPHYFENVKFDDINEASTVSACTPKDKGMTDLITEVVQDIHGVFSSGSSPGFLAMPEVTTMLPEGSCNTYNACLEFCENACLRTISVLTGDSAMPEDIVMIVKDTEDREITVSRALRNSDTRFDARFTVALPKGTFQAKFIKSSTQEQVWPGYAQEVFEKAPVCSNHIVPGDFAFEKPVAGRSPACDELIFNGDFDSEALQGQGWVVGGGYEWIATGGVDGSGAIRTIDRNQHSHHSLFAYLDVTCLEAGTTFNVNVSFKNIDADGNDVTNDCASGTGDCTRVKFLRGDWNGNRFDHRHVWPTASYSASGTFTTLSFQWTVNTDDASADFLRMEIFGGVGDILIDDVAVSKSSGTARKRNLRASS